MEIKVNPVNKMSKEIAEDLFLKCLKEGLYGLSIHEYYKVIYKVLNENIKRLSIVQTCSTPIYDALVASERLNDFKAHTRHANSGRLADELFKSDEFLVESEYRLFDQALPTFTHTVYVVKASPTNEVEVVTSGD